MQFESLRSNLIQRGQAWLGRMLLTPEGRGRQQRLEANLDHMDLIGEMVVFSVGHAAMRAFRSPKTGAIISWHNDYQPLAGKRAKLLGYEEVDGEPMFEIGARREGFGGRLLDHLWGSEIYRASLYEVEFEPIES